MNSQTTIEQLQKQVEHLKQEREAYRASAQEYRAVLDASMDAVLYTVPDGRILHANRAACDLFQMTEAELLAGGRACLYADNDEALARALHERRETGRFHGILNHYRKDGTVFPGEVSSVVFNNINGEERTCTIIRDRSKELQATREREEAVQKYKTLFETFPLGITISDAAGNIIETNASAQELLGIDREEHESRSLSSRQWQIIRPDGTPMPSEEWASVIALKERRRVENCVLGVVRPNEKIIWLNVTATPLPLAGAGVIVTYFDVTEEKYHKESLKKYKNIVSSTQDGIAFLDEEYRYQIVNDAYERFSGIKKETFIGLSVREYLGEDVFQEVVQPQFDKCLQGETINYQHWFDYPSLGRRFVDVTYAPYRDTGNRVVGVVVTTRDNTAQRLAEETLKNSEEQFRTLATLAPVGIYLTSPRGDCQYVNPAWCAMAGMHPEEAYGEGWINGLHPDDRSLVFVAWQKMVTEDSHWGLEYRFRTPEGKVTWVYGTASPQRDASGAILAYVGVNIDITERKMSEISLFESEQRWKNILVYVPQIGISLDPEAMIVFANGYFLQLTGWTEEEVVGRNWFDLCIPEDVREEVRQVFRTVMQQNDTLGFSTYENVIMDKSGKQLDVAWSNVLTWDRNGKILDVTCLGVDITERKRAERALQESAEKYRTILTSAMDGFWLTDTRGQILEVNDAYCSMTGYSRGELLSMRIGNVEVNEDDLQIAERMQKVLEIWSDRFESRHRRKDGTVFDVEVSVQYRPEKGGQCICFLRDITKRKDTIEELRNVSTKMKLAADSAHLGIWDYNILEDRLEWDDWMFRVYGIDRSSFTGEYAAWQTCLHPEDLKRACREVEQAVQGKQVFDTEFRIVRPDGEVRYIKASAALSYDDQGVPLRMTGINYDITERKKAELALKESEERFKALHNASFGGITIHDKGVILECNRGLSEITGYEYIELIGMNGLNLIADDTRDQVIRNIENGYEKPYEVSGVRKNGEIYPLRLEAREIPYKGKNVRVVEFRDMTEVRQMEQGNAELEARLHQAQKMEAIGRLAGGVAHDFNNMLGVIIGNAEEALEDISPGKLTYTFLVEIKKAAERSADLVQQLLAFARKQTVSPKIVDLNQTISGMTKMLHRIIGEDLDLVWLPGEHIWPIKVDPSQIDQILANLCVNSRDAIDDVGKITIETGNATFAKDYCSEHQGLVPGEYVLLAVSDNGCGMDISTLKNIFEPFFTTKETGKGTGLGLATVYGVVKQNNGFINVESEPDKGTTFRIYFPRYLTKTNVIADGANLQAIESGHETILLVEDESAILTMTKRMLERLGYYVIPASTPGEAIRLAREHSGKIDLLISDVIMPEMNGRDLARNILTLNPGLKRLFMSGYTANVIAHHGVLDDGVNFIEKPFSKGVLGRKVRTILDSD